MYGITSSTGTTSAGTTISSSATLSAGMWAVVMETTFCAATLPFTAGWSGVGLSTRPDMMYQSVSGPGTLTFASSNLEMQSIGWTSGGPWQFATAMAIFDTVPTIRQTAAPANNYSVPFTSNMTAGSTILVQAWGNLASTPALDFTITDTQGNTYAKLFYEVSPSGFLGEFSYLGLWIAQSASAGPNTITFTPVGATPSNLSPRILELSPTALIVPTLVSISITPTSASILTSATQQFTAIGTYSDSSTTDITNTATWASSSTGVATMNSSGLATGVSAGTTNITASLSGVTSNTAVLTVSAPTFTISGNAGVASVVVNWTGTSSGSTTADGSGNFTTSGLIAGNYVIAPSSLSGYIFTPTSRNETIVGSNITGVNFTLAGTVVTVTGTFEFANTARVANGFVTFTRRRYCNASTVQLLADGDPITAPLDGQGQFSVELPTYDSLVPATPYQMIVYDSTGASLMQRNVGFSGNGTHVFNDVPTQESGDDLPAQYAPDTGFRLVQGSFGSPAANGSVVFKLMQQAVSNEGVQVVPSKIVVQLDSSGNLVTNYLYLSAAMSPNTLYLVRVLDSNGVELSKLMYSLSETTPAICNLNDLLPSPTVAGITYSSLPGVFFVAGPWRKN